VRIEFFESGNLLGHLVAPIVDQNIDAWNSLAYLSKKISIALVADNDGCLRILETQARWIDVDSHNTSPLAKIVMPHWERSAICDADLNDHGRASSECREVPMVNLKIVMPFQGTSPRITVKILRKRVLSTGQVRAPCDGIRASDRSQEVTENLT